jgi:hypothetical protein
MPRSGTTVTPARAAATVRVSPTPNCSACAACYVPGRSSMAFQLRIAFHRNR